MRKEEARNGSREHDAVPDSGGKRAANQSAPSRFQREEGKKVREI
jgi:hypothetical protein